MCATHEWLPRRRRARVALSKTRCQGSFQPQRDRGCGGRPRGRPPPFAQAEHDGRRHTVPVQRSADRDQRQPMSKTIQTGSPVRGRFPRRAPRDGREDAGSGAVVGGCTRSDAAGSPDRRRLHPPGARSRCRGRPLRRPLSLACTGRADAAHRQSTGSLAVSHRCRHRPCVQEPRSRPAVGVLAGASMHDGPALVSPLEPATSTRRRPPPLCRRQPPEGRADAPRPLDALTDAALVGLEPPRRRSGTAWTGALRRLVPAAPRRCSQRSQWLPCRRSRPRPLRLGRSSLRGTPALRLVKASAVRRMTPFMESPPLSRCRAPGGTSSARLAEWSDCPRAHGPGKRIRLRITRSRDTRSSGPGLTARHVPERVRYRRRVFGPAGRHRG